MFFLVRPYSDSMEYFGEYNIVEKTLCEGLRQLKEKWSGSKLRRLLNRKMSLFISTNGEHIGVAANNQITVLQKDDNYMNPCGIFTSKLTLTYEKLLVLCRSGLLPTTSDLYSF